MFFKLRLSCVDIVFFSAYAIALSDCINNWQLYSTCTVPIHVYLLTSVALILLFRLCHFLGLSVVMSTDDSELGGFEAANSSDDQLNWNKLGRLIWLSYFLIFGLLPFFIGWTWWGTTLFFMIN